MNTAVAPKESKATMIDSSPLLDDPQALRERAESDGYLFFKQLLPKKDVHGVRRDLLAVVEKHGWRMPGQDAQGGVIDLDALNKVQEEEMRLDIGVSIAAYQDAQKLESPHRLPFGYFGMFYIALCPPLWFRVMDGRIQKKEIRHENFVA